jgi:hypothetical protein
MSTVDYGPLEVLIGTWSGDEGLDTSPSREGPKVTPYCEVLKVETVGDVTNAGQQTLSVLRYHKVAKIKASQAVFHDEMGYWMWDATSNIVMQSMVIPRGVALCAGGTPEVSSENGLELTVSTDMDSDGFGVVQSPFMNDLAQTVLFRHELKVKGKEMFSAEKTVLDIYGKTFDHTDVNQLIKAN